jgi:hypothetical protein
MKKEQICLLYSKLKKKYDSFFERYLTVPVPRVDGHNAQKTCQTSQTVKGEAHMD